jgi:multicomponent Na+:H+ antiporter subunit F
MNIDAFDIAFAFLSLSLLLALYRVVIGPRALDRVIGLELTSLLSVGLILTVSVQSDSTIALDVAVIMAVVAFLGSVTFAHYLERGTRA